MPGDTYSCLRVLWEPSSNRSQQKRATAESTDALVWGPKHKRNNAFFVGTAMGINGAKGAERQIFIQD